MTTTKTTLAQLSASTSPQVQANDNFDALSAAALFARRAAATTGLTWAYFGGIFNGNNIDDGTVALTNNATNYVSVLRSSGVVSVATNTTNYDSPNYARLYKVTTVSGAVTAYEDHRLDTNGLLLGNSTNGKHAIFVSAAAMQPSSSGGCAALAKIATSSGQPDISTLDFDATTVESAQFGIAMPKSWNEGTVTFRAHWSHASTATNFGAAWQLQAVAVSDNETIAVNFGTAISVTDTGGVTSNLYITAESAAVTVAGSPAAEDMVFFRVLRNPADAADTLAIDARLHGITVYITTDAGTDT